MELGMIGLGRMGANMVRRLMNKGHRRVVFARSPMTVNSGEGCWTIKAAIDEAVPVFTSALFEQFSRGEAEFSNRLLSAMR